MDPREDRCVANSMILALPRLDDLKSTSGVVKNDAE